MDEYKPSNWDPSTEIFYSPKSTKGSVVLEHVFRHINLVEIDYFGLRYCDRNHQTFLSLKTAIVRALSLGLEPPFCSALACVIRFVLNPDWFVRVVEQFLLRKEVMVLFWSRFPFRMVDHNRHKCVFHGLKGETLGHDKGNIIKYHCGILKFSKGCINAIIKIDRTEEIKCNACAASAGLIFGVSNVQNMRRWKLVSSALGISSIWQEHQVILFHKAAENSYYWLDPAKTLAEHKELINTGPPYTLYFGIKFYAEDPCKLKEEITRYQFFLQVKQDVLQGRLPCPVNTAAQLGAYAIQSELGDYDPYKHTAGGQAPSEAELNYLRTAKSLEMYGVALHPVYGENKSEYFLGLTPVGVVVYKNKKQVGKYFWPRITKVHFKETQFELRVLGKDNTTYR
eukprot:bmy_19662T0